jgi:hypothetical protein
LCQRVGDAGAVRAAGASTWRCAAASGQTIGQCGGTAHGRLRGETLGGVRLPLRHAGLPRRSAHTP